MSIRINTNISAINAHRMLARNNEISSRNLERLSSGQKINRGADGPAALVISERLRAQIGGIKQAIDNSEAGISLVQTAEGALDEVSAALVNARQLAVHAANEAVNDEVMLKADQQELENILGTINRIAKNTQYGTKTLLDGSKGGNGVTTGENLEYVGANEKTKGSGRRGYEVVIRQAATQAIVRGSLALDNNIIDRGEQITLSEGNKTVTFQTIKGETVETNLNALEKAIKDAGLRIRMNRPLQMNTDANAPQILEFQHLDYGSEHSFRVSSTTAGILSSAGDVYDTVQNGLDVHGEINGEEAKGRGQILTGGPGAAKVEGLQIRYTGEDVGYSKDDLKFMPLGATREMNFQQGLQNQAGKRVGGVTFSQTVLNFQVGANCGQTTILAIQSMWAKALGRGVRNESEFDSLQDIDLTSAEKAQDAMCVIDRALEEVNATRARLGAFQKNNLESNLSYLRYAYENLSKSESVIRDADIADEMTQFTRNQIMMDTTMAMLAQANQRPQSVLQLLQ
ncbi:MAG: flagellin [Deltaproteobacteria bacterium]|jgi:flagellin|nr:flagellin [SAR324 cluster bacterium]